MGVARARQPPALPMDLLLEIIARSDDVATVVRCAAACKPLRRPMLGSSTASDAARRPDPDSTRPSSWRPAASIADIGSVVVQPPGRLRLDTDLLPVWSAETASSRDGLLVVHRHGALLVCNTITGDVTSLPSTGWRASSGREMYQPALLSVDGGGRSFELLVLYNNFGSQIFSSQEGDWGAAREIHIHSLPDGALSLTEASSSPPTVMGRSVHWLCYIALRAPRSELIILALHAESAHASVIKLPQHLLTMMGLSSSPIVRRAEARILVTIATVGTEKRLSLVVAEALVISMRTLVPEAAEGSGISWSRQVVIRRREIDSSPLARVLDAYQAIRLCMFGERSGTVLFWMHGLGLVQLNLGTKKTLVLWRGSDKAIHRDAARAFLHEINLVSVLECMKSF